MTTPPTNTSEIDIHGVWRPVLCKAEGKDPELWELSYLVLLHKWLSMPDVQDFWNSQASNTSKGLEDQHTFLYHFLLISFHKRHHFKNTERT